MAPRLSPNSPFSLLDRMKTFHDHVAEVLSPEESATLKKFVAHLQDEEHRQESAAAAAEQAAQKAEMDKRRAAEVEATAKASQAASAAKKAADELAALGHPSEPQAP